MQRTSAPALNQCRNTLCVVAGIDACADYITLVLIEQLKRVCLVAVVVLAEYHINKVLLCRLPAAESSACCPR